jgi:hypothetical protein
MRKILLIALIGVLTVAKLPAQEFLCQVSINSQRVEGVDKSVFEAMKTSIFEFMNNRKWSSYNFRMEERIGCTMLFTIESASGGDDFSGKLNIVLERPIYKTDYSSPVINMIDKDIQFRYVPYQTMEYADNTYMDNFTSILAYYAYLMLALDFDTFSLYGGDEFYDKAQAVVNSAQSSPRKGWQAFEGPKNRAQLVAGLTNASYKDLRMFLYEYHRRGLDYMSEDVEGSRTFIGKSLRHFKKVNDKRPGLYPMQIFVETKRNEIVNIFKEATPAEKTGMINIMKEVDPANSSTYEAVNKGR